MVMQTADPLFSQSSKSSPDAGFKPLGDDEKKVTKEQGKEGGDPSKEGESNEQEKEDNVNNTNTVNTTSTNEVNVVGAKTSIELPDDPNMPKLEDNRLCKAMQEELLQFKLQEVWTLVDLPNRKRAIGTKWVFRNKKDGRGIMIKNKARLVVQGYTHKEGIDYDEVFAPVARIEAIRLFLAYASFKDFVVYQMDVKSAFVYGKIKEEVYVCQPSGFEDPEFPDRVYKVKNALYGLHQASRVWYETLSTYLLDNGFQRGKVDKTLFIRREKGNILLVQVYVDDIIFGSTKKSLCTEFKKMMHKKFKMSSIGELTFFLGLQVKQKKDGIFISQDKSMIGSLMYLTSSRPDIMFAVCACARYQVNPKVLHLHAIKRILESVYTGIGVNAGNSKLMLLGITYYCYWKVNAAAITTADFEQTVDFLNANPIRYALTINPTIYTSYIEQFWATTKVKTVNGEVQLQALVDGKKIIVTEASVRRDLQLNDEEGTDCLPNATIFEELTRMGMVKNLENVSGKFLMYPRFVQVFLEKQLEGMSNHKMIYVTPSHTKKIFGNIRRVGKGFSGRDTSLFLTMMVQAQQEQGEGSAMPTDPQHPPTIIQPSTSQPQLKQRSRRPKRKDTKVPQSSGPTDNVADEAVCWD
ncbi:putative ribonuclease H-like domain-containing protein [Tanacetum coccineum]